MSVISIRPATEKLQNLGDLRRPDRMPHFVAPDRSGQAAMARSYGDLGRGVGRLGDALAAIAIKAKREDEDRRLAGAGAEYQRRLQEGFLEGDDPIMLRKGDALEDDGLKKTQGDTEKLFTTAFNSACEQYGISGKLKEKFALHVAPVALSWNGRLDNHINVERQKNKITEADSLFDEDQKSWAGDRFNAKMTQKLLDDYDHKLDVRGVTKDVRASEVRKYAIGLAADIARSSFDGLDSEEAFDNQIKVLEEKPDELFADNTELKTRLGSNALPEDTVKLLVSEAKMRKEQFVRERIKAVNDEVDAVVAEGDLGKMDKLVDDLKEKAKPIGEDGTEEGGTKKVSKIRTATLQAAAKLDKAADELCQYEIMNDLVNGINTTYPEGTRQARLSPAVKAAYDARQEREFTQAFKAAHDQNRLVARMAMLEYAAAGNPQGYLNWLASQVVDKKLSVNDFTTLRNEFQNGWMQGFKGQGMQLPKQMQLASKMLETLKDKLGVDYAASVKRSASGEIQLDKYGLLQTDEKAEELPEIKYSRKTGGWFNSTERIGPDDILSLMNRSLSMAMLDGSEVPFDPVTGDRLPEGKLHRVDAVNDFSAFVDHLKDEKKVLGAARELANRAAYMNNVRSWASVAETDRTTRMIKSKPVNSGDEGGKEEK